MAVTQLTRSWNSKKSVPLLISLWHDGLTLVGDGERIWSRLVGALGVTGRDSSPGGCLVIYASTERLVDLVLGVFPLLWGEIFLGHRDIGMP